MSKYDPLYEYLKRNCQSIVRLTFSEIEKILADKLPASAYKYAAWWANGSHIQANAWLEAGYIVDNVNWDIQVVTFHK